MNSYLAVIKFKVEMAAPFYLISIWCAKKGATNGLRMCLYLPKKCQHTF